MRHEHVHHIVHAPRSTDRELPRDLSRPRDPNRASLIANIVAASVTGITTLVLLAYAVLVVPW